MEDTQYVRRPHDTTPHEDETPRKYISSDKISITKYDVTKQEETESRKYPKDVDIGRIVIEEIPDEQELGPTRELDKPRDTQVAMTRKEVKDISKPRETSISVGKLDLRDVEKEVVESSKKEKTIKTQTERLDYRHRFVTDQHSVSERKIDVTDERVLMGMRPTDKIYMNVEKREDPSVITDKIDGPHKVDDRTGDKKKPESISGRNTN